MLLRAAPSGDQPVDDGAVVSDVVLVAGTHLVRLAAATGKPVAEPVDLRLRPCREPVMADVDGDRRSEILLVTEDGHLRCIGGAE